MYLYDCKEVSEMIKDQVKGYTNEYHLMPVALTIITNGSKEGDRYIRNKIKVGIDCGIKITLLNCNSHSPEEVIALIRTINEPMIVQMPFTNDKATDEYIISHIPPEYDADGLTKKALVNPATAQGIFTYLKVNKCIDEKNIAIIGRSNLVGKPLAKMLMDTDATVTLCHSKTMNIKEITKNADVIVSAVGNKEYFTLDYVNQEKMVRIVDVGINFTETGKLCGDIPKSAIGPRTFVTPVPGGVGLLTTASLMHNVIKLHARF